jgi:uncharacterized protein (UPF0335 family)
MPRGRPKKHATADGAELRNSFAVDGAELHAYIERAENVNQQIADSQADRRELYAEIKRAGYDVPTVRAIVKERAMDADKKRTRNELIEEYTAALGDFASTPLGQAGAEAVQ